MGDRVRISVDLPDCITEGQRARVDELIQDWLNELEVELLTVLPKVGQGEACPY